MTRQEIDLMRGLEEAIEDGVSIRGDDCAEQDVLASLLHSRYIAECEDTGSLSITKRGAEALEQEGR